MVCCYFSFVACCVTILALVGLLSKFFLLLLLVCRFLVRLCCVVVIVAGVGSLCDVGVLLLDVLGLWFRWVLRLPLVGI